MISFDEIMTTLEKENIGTVVKNCLPTSVVEAKEAIKHHPNLKLEVLEISGSGTCIAICPKDFKTTAAAFTAVKLKGHRAVSRFFRRNKR